MVKITDDQTGKFWVELFNINDKENNKAESEHDSLMAAYQVYEKVVGWIIFNFYDKESIYEYMQSRTMK